MDVLLEDTQDGNGHDDGAHDHHHGDGDGDPSYRACTLLCKRYHTSCNPQHLTQALMHLDLQHDDDGFLVQNRLQLQNLELAFYIYKAHNLVEVSHLLAQ